MQLDWQHRSAIGTFSPSPPPEVTRELKLCEQCGVWFTRARQVDEYHQMTVTLKGDQPRMLAVRSPVTCRACGSAEMRRLFISPREMEAAQRTVSLTEQIKQVKKEAVLKFRAHGAEHPKETPTVRVHRRTARHPREAILAAVHQAFQVKSPLTAREIGTAAGWHGNANHLVNRLIRKYDLPLIIVGSLPTARHASRLYALQPNGQAQVQVV